MAVCPSRAVLIEGARNVCSETEWSRTQCVAAEGVPCESVAPPNGRAVKGFRTTEELPAVERATQVRHRTLHLRFRAQQLHCSSMIRPTEGIRIAHSRN